tara:strand:- start:8810 stop:9343 length:534 start_codon:yes stop_codon:yes gene_type:complete
MAARLEIIVGPMFSGKTTALIDKFNDCTEKNIKTTVINFIDDQRYSEKMLSNHDQIMIPCIQSRTLSEIEENSIHDVILINEAQFFEDLYDFVLTHLDKNKKIYLYGLDGDFKRNKFGSLLDLVPYCDSIIKKTAICHFCKSRAIFSHRLSQEKDQVVIGSTNYIPLCRRCYKNNTS